MLIHTYAHTYICSYIHMFIHTYIHTYMHTYICSYIHMLMHIFSITHMYTLVHIYIYDVQIEDALAVKGPMRAMITIFTLKDDLEQWRIEKFFHALMHELYEGHINLYACLYLHVKIDTYIHT